MIAQAPDPSLRTLIDELLEEQKRLTAVDRFSRVYDHSSGPAQARYYRDLLPLSRPAPGQQYAFAVDLDVCTGCKGCVSACHSLNGLDDDEIWRNVGLLHSANEAYQQTVTTACHHCVDPACANGCPVLAYDKDPETGIVRHLDDQCIGCQYCVLKCPYDVPKYSEKRGIVRKCDMCYNRLVAGEAPACVQACPTQAISIRVVDQAEVARGSSSSESLLPGTVTSDYTRPTTLYSTEREIPADARPSDSEHLRLEHAHWPLVWMLVLTQMAVGLFLGAGIGIAAGPQGEGTPPLLAGAGFLLLQVGLGVSVLHLGRPMGAWRAFLGLRRSWMSREIVVFGLFAGLAAAFTGAAWWDALAQWIAPLGMIERWIRPSDWSPLLALGTAAVGTIAVFCSAMIYVDTRRPFWAAELTVPRFFGTTLLLGASGAAAILAWYDQHIEGSLRGSLLICLLIGMIVRVVLAGWEVQGFVLALREDSVVYRRSVVTLLKLHRPLLITWALVLAGASAATLFAAAAASSGAAKLAALALLLTFIGQMIERYFFFTAGLGYRMPGHVSASQTLHA